MSYNEFEDLDHIESKGMTFDFKGFLFKVLHLWKLIFLSIAVALIIAYSINIRKENIYRLGALVSIV